VTNPLRSLALREGLRDPERVDIRRKTFVAEATSRLGFLILEHGFNGPEITQTGGYPLLIRVSYHRSDLDVEESLILSYGGEEYVTANVVHSRPDSGSAVRTGLSAGTAHTGFQMRQVLDRHARALRELLGSQQPESPAKRPG
jgi:hypothetical protein